MKKIKTKILYQINHTNLRKNFWKTFVFPLAILVGVILFFTLPDKSQEAEQYLPYLDLAEKIDSSDKDTFITIGELSLAENPVVFYGTTTSRSQVSVFAEIPGKITRIYAKLGDYVNEGDIIVALEKETESNNLVQAQLGLASAQRGLEKTLSGTQDEDKTIAILDVQIKKDAIEKTNVDISSEFEDIKILLESTLRRDIDDFFGNTDKKGVIYSPTFVYRIRDEKIETQLETDRIHIEEEYNIFLLNQLEYSIGEKMSQSIAVIQLFSNLAKMLSENAQDFLGSDDNKKEELEEKALAIKTSLDVQITLWENLENQLLNQQSSLSIAETTLAKINAGPREEDVNIAQANIDSNENYVESANNALSKKTIRAPIAGKITEMSADIGQLAPSSAPIFSIQNPDNLKVLASIPANQRVLLFTGKEIMVENITAKVSAISPIISAETGMIHFEAVFTAPLNNLLSGTPVKITIPAKQINDTEKYTQLPLSSVFEESGIYFVFLLNEKLQAEKKEISFVKISGSHIIAKNIFTGTEQLIINARGISEGDEL